VIPNEKRFTSETARIAGRKGGAVQAENFSIQKGLRGAFAIYGRRKEKEVLDQARAYVRDHDLLGLQVFFLEMLESGGEDRRAMLGMVRSMLPIQVQGAFDASLTVIVNTFAGASEIDITRVKEPPKDALREAVPVPLLQRAPEVEVDG
jgi:hypothetical protein